MAGGTAAGVGQPGTQGGMPQAGTGQAGTQTGMPQQGAGMAQQGSMPMGSLPNFGGGAFTPGMAQQGTGIQNPPAGTSPFYGGAATMADDFRGQQGSGMPFGQVLQGLGMNRPQGMPLGVPPQMTQGMGGLSQTPEQRMGASVPQVTAQIQQMDRLLAEGQIPQAHRAAFAQDYQAKLAALQSAMQGMPQGMPQGPVLDEGMRSPFAPPVQQMDQAKLAALQSAMQGTPMGQPPAPTAQSIAQNISPGISGLMGGLTGRPTPSPTPTPAPALTRPATQLVRPAPVAPTPTPAAKPVVAPKPPIKQTPITTKKSMAR